MNGKTFGLLLAIATLGLLATGTVVAEQSTQVQDVGCDKQAQDCWASGSLSSTPLYATPPCGSGECITYGELTSAPLEDYCMPGECFRLD